MARDEFGGFSGGGSVRKPAPSRFTGKFFPAERLIRLLNAPVMQDRYVEVIFGRPVPARIINALKHLAGLGAVRQRHPKTSALKKAVRLANDCSPQPARDDMARAEDMGLIASEQDGAARYFFLTPEQYAALARYLDALDTIEQVIQAQKADPGNPRAGASLVPEGVYYNIVEAKQMRAAHPLPEDPDDGEDDE